MLKHCVGIGSCAGGDLGCVAVVAVHDEVLDMSVRPPPPLTWEDNTRQ